MHLDGLNLFRNECLPGGALCRVNTRDAAFGVNFCEGFNVPRSSCKKRAILACLADGQATANRVRYGRE